MTLRFICEGCDTPCVLSFDDDHNIAMPVKCPYDGEKVDWNELLGGDE